MFKLNFSTDNAAFEDENSGAGPEIARILRDTANRIQNGMHCDSGARPIRDANGNTVGTWEFVAPEADEA